jgi:Domain of unknown function (DUF222)
MFDIADHLDELRCWPTDRLRRELDALVGEQRRLRTKELAVLRVLDERGQVDPTLDERGESPREMRDKLETARALESLPEIAAVAYEGELSSEQLSSVTKLADEASDAEWARRAPRVAPVELARLARNAVKPSTEDSRQRYEARSLRMWWTPDKGMLQLHGQLPDVMGATFEATIQHLTEQAKPGKGQAWDSFEHRAADALVGLCERRDPREGTETPTLAPRPVVQVHVPEHGPAEIAGIPIADSLLEQLRANASIEPVLVDDDGVPGFIGKRTPATSPKVVRAVLLRDGHCRCTDSCDVTWGLQVHHLRPRSWGGSDDPSNLIAIASGHHPPLIPHGPWALVGNPNLPDGIDRVHLDTSAPNNANSSASHHHAPDRRPREEDDAVRCTSSRAPCALDARRRRRCRRAGRRASGW